jgi:hypothetical protein
MKSDIETRIPLETFHRHFICTHLKGKSAEVLDQLQQQAHRSDKPFGKVLREWMKSSCYLQSGFRDDAWYAKEIPLNNCYFAHTDFRLRPVPKDHLFVEFMYNKREEIDAGVFPCSAEIRAPWSGPMPEPLVQERGDERYYILDGQLRVIRHWYHSVPNVKIFIYRGQLAV